ASLARLHGGTGRRQGLSAARAAAPVVLQPVLARARHHLGRRVHDGLSDGGPLMDGDEILHLHDRTPGVRPEEPTADFLTYTAGLAFAIPLTIDSSVVAQTNLLSGPGAPV